VKLAITSHFWSTLGLGNQFSAVAKHQYQNFASHFTVQALADIMMYYLSVLGKQFITEEKL